MKITLCWKCTVCNQHDEIECDDKIYLWQAPEMVRISHKVKAIVNCDAALYQIDMYFQLK